MGSRLIWTLGAFGIGQIKFRKVFYNYKLF